MEIKWHAIKLQCWLIGLQCHLYATRFKCQFMVNVVKDVLELNVITKKYEKKNKKKNVSCTLCFLIYQKYEDLKKSLLSA